MKIITLSRRLKTACDFEKFFFSHVDVSRSCCKFHSGCQDIGSDRSRSNVRTAKFSYRQIKHYNLKTKDLDLHHDYERSQSYHSYAVQTPLRLGHLASSFSDSDLDESVKCELTPVCDETMSSRHALTYIRQLTPRSLWTQINYDPLISFLKSETPRPRHFSTSTFLGFPMSRGASRPFCLFYNKLFKKQNIDSHLHQLRIFNFFRSYSKDTDSKEENKNNDDILNDLLSDKDKLEKFPDLKNILDELKNDFSESSLSIASSDSSSNSDSSSSSDDESPNTDQKSSSQHVLKSAQEEEYIYDYRYADDIEDFGFSEDREGVEEETIEKIVPVPLTRGKDGVFDLDELLTFLDHLGAENVVTVDVAPEANYCDNMVVCSAKSQRHLQFINDEFLWIHKRKKGSKDPHLHIEGLKRSEWCAMDMGNIVLHVFYGDAREYYDIESLWTLGPENDPKCQEQVHDPLALSEEDLFWLEASITKGKEKELGDGETLTDDSGTPSGSAAGQGAANLATSQLDEEAGWGELKPKSPSK